MRKKTYKSTQEEVLHLGWVQPQDLQPPKRSSELMQSETDLHYSKNNYVTKRFIAKALK